jgi:hypothetical protein
VKIFHRCGIASILVNASVLVSSMNASVGPVTVALIRLALLAECGQAACAPQIPIRIRGGRRNRTRAAFLPVLVQVWSGDYGLL